MKLTVGEEGADIIGSDGVAIQRAIDTLAKKGGGTVQVLPGTYPCQDALHLRSQIRLIGEREKTFLVHGPAISSPLVMDADIGEKQITPISTEGFSVGMGVILRDQKKPNNLAPMPLTIERIENGTLYVNDWIIHDWCAEEEACVLAYAPLIHAYEVEDIHVEGFTLDGSVKNPPKELEGVVGGNLYFRRVKNAVVRNVTSRKAYGDGFRCGQSQNIVVEDCEAHDNSNYGAHPGSHSHPVRFSRLHIHHNASDGLYICWGIKNSVFEDCKIHHNGHGLHRNGLCIGHKDTGNLIRRNHIYENHKHGIHIRKKTEANGAHQNIFQDNLIENNGSAMKNVPDWLKAIESEDLLKGYGMYVHGVVGIIIENNIIRETREGNARTQRIGLFIAPEVKQLQHKGNTIQGHPEEDMSGI